jgi:hypothetical protein
MMGSNDASFVQDKGTTNEEHASGVVPVARKASGQHAISPRARYEQVIRLLTETAIEAYKAAAESRAAGSDRAADDFAEAGDRAQALCVEAQDALRGLSS